MKTAAPIIVVAPYSPVGSGDIPALGAAKKIASVVGALSVFGREVILVNSAHNATKRAGMTVSLCELRPGLKIRMVTLPTQASRPVGKVVNLLLARSLAKKVAREFASDGVALLWIYNGYAFESRFALELVGRTGCPLVVELEDMPFARKRPGNLKPKLDDYYLRRILPKATLVTCVNEPLANSYGIASGKKLLLPGLVDENLVDAMTSRRPFSGPFRTVGYFGNLSEEKGADLLLRVIERSPANWKFIVTGTGVLAEKFSAKAGDAPDVLKFFHNASDAEVTSQMLECDVIINPHRPIADMGNGVFPFKVIEGLASGRLVISTAVPSCGLDLESAILFFEGSAESLCDALDSAYHFYISRQDRVDAIAREVNLRHSESALSSEIRRRVFPVGS